MIRNCFDHSRLGVGIEGWRWSSGSMQTVIGLGMVAVGCCGSCCCGCGTNWRWMLDYCGDGNCSFFIVVLVVVVEVAVSSFSEKALKVSHLEIVKSVGKIQKFEIIIKNFIYD